MGKSHVAKNVGFVRGLKVVVKVGIIGLYFFKNGLKNEKSLYNIKSHLFLIS